MSKVKCAVIGTGYLGKFHAEKYASLPNIELVAVCDPNYGLCQNIANQYKTKAFEDHRALLGKVDAVSIVVPTSLHYQITKDFLQHRTHVLLEKPMTTTIAEAEELIELAARHELVLQIGHLERFNPVILALQSKLSRPLFIESIRLAPYKPRATDVNVILDLMIHDLDLVQSLTNSPIKQIVASGAPVLSKDIDIVNARIEFVNCCVANITASRVSFEAQRKIRIFAKESYYSADLQNKLLSIHHKGSKEMFPGIPEIISEEIALNNNDALVEEIKSFLRSVENRTSPVISGEDGLRALQTALQITEIVNQNLANLHKF